MKKVSIIFLILFITTSLLAKEKYTFFGIEMGKPLKNEKILTGEFDFWWEVFKPLKENATFNKYLLIRGMISKSVYGIQITGPMESWDKCIFNKVEYWDDIFIKKYPFIKKELLVNNDTAYGHTLFFKDKLNIVTKCLSLNSYILYIQITVDEEKKLQEDDEYFKKIRKEELSKNDLTGFDEN